jgi:type I restriction enzyme S subunit
MPETSTLLTGHLDLWTSAIARKGAAGRSRSKKVNLYGIDKLRALILDLAVRGKLVPQDTADETALELLKRIKVLKTDLSAERKIKRSRPLASIQDAEKPFDIPNGWRWVRLAEIATYIQRGKSPQYDDQGSVAVISQKCIQWDGFRLDAARHISDASLSGYQPERFLQDGDLLWNSTGTGTVGRACVLQRDSQEPIVADSHVTIVRTCLGLGSYILKYLSCPTIQSRMDPQCANPLVSGTTNQVELNTSAVGLLPVPVPPLAEQRRIVAKVDELMALCDQLEAGTYEAVEAHQLLVTELLATLTASRDADALATNWARIETQFDSLFVTEASVDQLKQTILQLAIMGKLVPQDPKDEPASELLKRIIANWKRLVSERGIRGARPPSSLARDILGYTYPETWKLAPLGQVSIVTDPNPSHRYPDYDGGTVPLLSTQEFSGESGWNYASAKHTTEAFWQFQQEICAFAEGDIIFARKGRLGLPRFLPVIDRFTFSHTVFVIKPIPGVDPNYLLWFLRRQRTVEWLTNEMNQNTGVPTLGKAKMERLPIPLPPFSEQKRIVAKIEQLMGLCDALRSKLGKMNENTVHVADAIVAKAVV